jgi:hypothetical protein
MAGALGFEPRLVDPESTVLPLYYAPVGLLSIDNYTFSVKYLDSLSLFDTIEL